MTKSGDTPRRGRPFLKVKHGSAVVPIYRQSTREWTRYTVCFYLDGQRIRRTFGSLEKAKTEAYSAARKIQEGMQATNDLAPQEREMFLAARTKLAPLGTPLTTAVDEYVICRERLGNVPLISAIEDFLLRSQGIQLGAKVPDIVQEFLKAKEQDGASKDYISSLRQYLARFAETFPGEIRRVQSGDIDRWLRSYKVTAVTRNGMLRCIKVLFSFAKTRSYLPKAEKSEAELVPKAKEPPAKTEIFVPAQIEQLLKAAPNRLVPMLAIGGFAGLRAAEMARLDWSAIDLERRIITLRADQAKTGSRRIVPISDNLAAWLKSHQKKGKIVGSQEWFIQMTELARTLKFKWPHNGLRHSYISYRVALTGDVNRVALEAGNSPAMIFKHYLELVTEQDAKKWFGIQPPAKPVAQQTAFDADTEQPRAEAA